MLTMLVALLNDNTNVETKSEIELVSNPAHFTPHACVHGLSVVVVEGQG